MPPPRVQRMGVHHDPPRAAAETVAAREEIFELLEIGVRARVVEFGLDQRNRFARKPAGKAVPDDHPELAEIMVGVAVRFGEAPFDRQPPVGCRQMRFDPCAEQIIETRRPPEAVGDVATLQRQFGDGAASLLGALRAYAEIISVDRRHALPIASSAERAGRATERIRPPAVALPPLSPAVRRVPFSISCHWG